MKLRTGAAGVAGVTVVQRNLPVPGADSGGLDNQVSLTMPVPVSSGNALIVGYVPTLGESVESSVRDQLARNFVYLGGFPDGRFWILANAGGASTVTITVDSLIDCRLYAWEVSGLSSPVGYAAADVTPAASEAETITMTATARGLALAVVAFGSPSGDRYPLGINGTYVNQQYNGGNPANEHSLDKIVTGAGSVSLEATWTGQGVRSGRQISLLVRSGP